MTQNETKMKNIHKMKKEGRQPIGKRSPERGDDEQRLKQLNPQTDTHRGALQCPHRATEEHPTHLWMEIFSR